MFILANEFRRCFSNDKAYQELVAWNDSMGAPLRSEDIYYRIYNNKQYKLSDTYILTFLKSLGFESINAP